jgi:hypothetical protein
LKKLNRQPINYGSFGRCGKSKNISFFAKQKISEEMASFVWIFFDVPRVAKGKVAVTETKG